LTSTTRKTIINYILFTLLWIAALFLVTTTMEEMAGYILFAIIYTIGISVYLISFVIILLVSIVKHYKKTGSHSIWRLSLLILFIALMIVLFYVLVISGQIPDWVERYLFPL
jgi:hypothetical protein